MTVQSEGRENSQFMSRFENESIRRVSRGSLPVPNNSQIMSNGDIGKRLLKVGEAARYLGLKVDTVYKKARLREVPSVKVGRALRFDIRALERFVEEHTFKTID